MKISNDINFFSFFIIFVYLKNEISFSIYHKRKGKKIFFYVTYITNIKYNYIQINSNNFLQIIKIINK